MRSGVFLVEAVAGMLILVAAMLTLVSIFHSSAHYFNQSQKVNEAVLLAQQKIAEIRAAGTDLAQFSAGLPVYASSTTNQGIYTIETTVGNHSLFSPSTTLETPYGGLAKEMTASALQVIVRVSWPGSTAALEPTVTTIVGEPYRRPRRVRVSANGATAPIQYTATYEDSDGNVIPDVVFSWALVSGSTRATLATTTRMGDVSDLTSGFLDVAGVARASSGTVRTQVSASYAGINRSALAPVVNF